MKKLEEPLAESAPLARRLALALCRRDPVTAESCAWTHGFWQYLRLMGLASGPTHHAEFFRTAFDGVTGDTGAPRVLVCGSADYSMLAHVLWAFRARAIEADVTVIDLCEAPLALSRWYAQRMGCRIRTACCDVLAYVAPHPFDAICTHSFLSYFSPDRRVDLLAKWRQLLRPGGAVITVNALRPGAAADRVGLNSAQARALREDVLARAQTMRSAVQLDPLELARDAEIYAGKLGFWRVQSGEEVRALFERSGFRMDRLICGPAAIASASQSAVTGPTSPVSTDYAHIVATRV
ncbi:MAG TPA: class I SAM-dependent methyltransferase [Burkholderiales bacterium]